MNYPGNLKNALTQNASEFSQKNGFDGIKHQTAYVFNDLSMNFFTESFENISLIADYKKRLSKLHSHFKDSNIFEMQSSNSSDALLMNIFANPNILKWKSLRNLLLVSENEKVVFGWNPILENETNNKTEIDMLIGNNIFEAKLTESDFTSKEISIVNSYPHVNDILDLSLLTNDKRVSNYQLIRNVVVAYKYDFNFYLLVDERRLDLIREFYNVKLAIKDKRLSERLFFITWQEIVACVGKDLKQFITEKYFK